MSTAMPRFESSRTSQPVRSRRRSFRLCENRPHFRGLGHNRVRGAKLVAVPYSVMAGLVPAISTIGTLCAPDRDRRDKPDDDARAATSFAPLTQPSGLRQRVFRVWGPNPRFCHASLCPPFSNFRFGMPQTGSTMDEDRFAGRDVGDLGRPAACEAGRRRRQRVRVWPVTDMPLPARDGEKAS